MKSQQYCALAAGVLLANLIGCSQASVQGNSPDSASDSASDNKSATVQASAQADAQMKKAVSEDAQTQLKPDGVAPMPKGITKDNAALYQYGFNGRKFTSSSATLHKGVVVFDSQMSTFGTVKGTLVLVTKSVPSQFSHGFQVAQIAANTYRLRPTDESVSLIKYLKDLSSLGAVEIEVDYSGVSDAANM